MAKRYYNTLVKNTSNNRSDLPQDAMIKDCPEIPTGGMSDYNDEMSGIDAKIKADIKSMNRKGKISRW